MIVKIDWSEGLQSMWTNIHPIRNRLDEGMVLVLHSKDGKVTREVYCNKANFITFIEEPDDEKLLAKEPKFLDSGVNT